MTSIPSSALQTRFRLTSHFQIRFYNNFDSKLRPPNSIQIDFTLPNSIRIDFRLPNSIHIMLWTSDFRLQTQSASLPTFRLDSQDFLQIRFASVQLQPSDLQSRFTNVRVQTFEHASLTFDLPLVCITPNKCTPQYYFLWCTVSSEASYRVFFL